MGGGKTTLFLCCDSPELFLSLDDKRVNNKMAAIVTLLCLTHANAYRQHAYVTCLREHFHDDDDEGKIEKLLDCVLLPYLKWNFMSRCWLGG